MLNLLQMFEKKKKMPIAGLIVILYVVIAEWRIAKMKKRWISCVSCLAKMQKDKTLWYSGVLPQADALCLFEDADGKYLISTLNGTPSADFSKIKRWIYLKDLENICKKNKVFALLLKSFKKLLCPVNWVVTKIDCAIHIK